MKLTEKAKSLWVRALDLLFLVCTMLAWPYMGRAQSDYLLQTGIPTFTTPDLIQLGFVNIANGDLHLEIPFAASPQRGSLSAYQKMLYDSRFWSIVDQGSTRFWSWNQGMSGNWRPGDSTSPGSILSNFSMVPCDNYPGFKFYYRNFRWRDSDGTWHALSQDLYTLDARSCWPPGGGYAHRRRLHHGRSWLPHICC
jgi:hypothetical protein